MDSWEEYESMNEDDSPQYPNGDEAVCGCCGEDCLPMLEDVGIGDYEFWGAKCRDKRMEWVSDCCKAPLMDKEDEE